MFKKAERKKARLRLAILGPSGSGKTYSSILIASGLGGKIALLDTERGSGELYSHLCDYDVAQPTTFHPREYVKIIKGAEAAGYDVLIIDSLSHAWAGQGGLLEEVDKRSGKGNDFAAWREITPEHNALVEAMLQSPMHIIATMRTKQTYVLVDEVKNGRTIKVPKKVGLQPVQRDGLEYEFTVVLDVDIDRHMATASKDRTGLFDDQVFQISPETGQSLLEWLERGVEANHPAHDGLNQYTAFDLEKVQSDFDSCHAMDAVANMWRSLGLKENHPQLKELTAIKDQAKARLQFVGDSQVPAEGQRTSDMMNDGQRKALMASYKGKSREQRLADASNFLGRQVESFNDLTFSEASSLLNALNEPQEA